MKSHEDAIERLDKQVTELSDALAHLGRGTDLKELLRIIKNPGWTTPAELAFATTIVESMQNQVTTLNKLSTDLLKTGRLVGVKTPA